MKGDAEKESVRNQSTLSTFKLITHPQIFTSQLVLEQTGTQFACFFFVDKDIKIKSK